jgi:ATP-binding cassette subfamily B protein
MQLALLAMGLASLAIVGQAIDTIAHCAAGKREPLPWLLGLSAPRGWTPLATTAALAAAVLAIATVRAVLSYWYAVASARLLQEQIVVELRAKVYEKLQRLSLRFFTANVSGSLINRVTGDVQSVRLFVA